MVAEIKIAWVIQRHKMNVRMRNVYSDNGDTNLYTWTDLFEALSHLAAEAVQFYKKIVIEVENVVDLFFRDAEYMAANDRVYIEECQTVIRLGDFIAGNLTCNNF